MSIPEDELLFDDAFGSVAETPAPSPKPTKKKKKKPVAKIGVQAEDTNPPAEDVNLHQGTEEPIEHLKFYQLVTGASNFRQDMVYNLVRIDQNSRVIRLTPSTLSAEDTVVESVVEMYSKKRMLWKSRIWGISLSVTGSVTHHWNSEDSSLIPSWPII